MFLQQRCSICQLLQLYHKRFSFVCYHVTSYSQFMPTKWVKKIQTFSTSHAQTWVQTVRLKLIKLTESKCNQRIQNEFETISCNAIIVVFFLILCECLSAYLPHIFDQCLFQALYTLVIVTTFNWIHGFKTFKEFKQIQKSHTVSEP